MNTLRSQKNFFAIDSQQLVGVMILAAAFLSSLIAVVKQFGDFNASEATAATSLGLTIACVSFVYMVTLTAAWSSNVGYGTSLSMLFVIRIGAFASTAYLIVALFTRISDYAVVIAHVCNLLFWSAAERSPRGTAHSSRVAITVCSALVLSTVTLYLATIEYRRLQKEKAEFEQYSATVRQESDRKSKTELPNSAIATKAAHSQQTLRPDGSRNSAKARHVHQLGSENARVRFVVYYDYENNTCRQIERDLQELLAKYPGSVSLTARHYPASANSNAPLELSARPEACRFNLAVETASIVDGEDGFWQMHRRLLSGTDTVSENESGTAIAETIYNPQALTRVFSDIVEARSKGVQSAPAVLLNDTRLYQYDKKSLEREIQTVLGTVVKGDVHQANGEFASAALALESFPHEQQLAAALATVRIVGPNASQVGSGIIFSVKGTFVYVLTASHLTRNARSVSVDSFSAASYPNSVKTHDWATVVAVSKTSDLSIVRFSTREHVPNPLQILPVDLAKGLSQFDALTTGCDGAESPPTCMSNRVLGAQKLRRTDSEPPSLMWEAESASQEGRSGGALIAPNGYLVGIASGNSNGKAYFSHIEEIHKLLDESGLSGLFHQVTDNATN